MDEDQIPQSFGGDVDRIMETGSANAAQDGRSEYAGILKLAEALAGQDFSDGSGVRVKLRSDLLANVGKAGRTRGRMGGGIKRAALMLAALAIGLFFVAMAKPGALTVAARQLEGFVQRLALGGDTVVIQDMDTRTPDGEELRADEVVTIWIARTSSGRASGRPGERAPGPVRTFGSYAEVRAAVGFPVSEPAWLPPDYFLRKVTLSDLGLLIGWYDGPKGALLLARVSQEPTREAIATNGASATIEVLTDRPIEPATVNGRPAAWVQGRSLSWALDGVSYVMGISNLSREDAIRIAESLR